MKSLIVFLGFFISVSTYAGTLSCAGEGLALSENHSDGGAPRIPTIQLVVNGNILVDEGLNRTGARLAAYSLIGNPIELKKKPVKSGDYKISYFRQQLSANDLSVPNPAIYFIGEVVCRQSVYVGPPRP